MAERSPFLRKARNAVRKDRMNLRIARLKTRHGGGSPILG
jgi:hypothetical protein